MNAKLAPYLPCYRDNSLPKVPGLNPVAASGNTYLLYCRPLAFMPLNPFDKMRILLAVLFCNLTSLVYSQGDQIILKILPDKTITNDRVVFNGTIINNSKKTFKAIPISYNCNKQSATVFWDLRIYKNGIKFTDFSYDLVISNPPYPIEEEIHLKKNSQFEFKVCVNLNWLISDSDLRQFLKERTRYSNDSRIYQPLMPKDYHNPDSGTYSIQLVYPSRIDKSIDTLVSNSVFIKYTGRINNK